MYKESDIKLNRENGQVQSANCVLENGFEFTYIMMRRGGVLTVIDGRRASAEPVGIITNYTAATIDEIEVVVKKMIHLYKAHEIISMALSYEEFDSTFRKIA